MQKSAGKRAGIAGFDPQGCVDFLRRRHPVKTAAEVAAATGDPARTVEGWLTQKSRPTLAAFARLAAAYGPAFVAAAIPGLRFAGHLWVERAAALASYEGLGAEIDLLRARQERIGNELRGGS